MKALIVVDLQNDFVPGGALAVPEGDQIIPAVNRLSRKFEFVVATQDCHPANHASFAVNHPGHRPGDVMTLGGLKQELWSVHCVENTPGADFVDKLNLHNLKAVFKKGTNPVIDSYSCFFDNGHLKSTGLAEYLKDNHVDEIFLAGLATDYCVRYSALDAVREGFKTNVVIDACRGIDLKPGDIDRAIKEMVVHGIRIVTSDSIYP